MTGFNPLDPLRLFSQQAELTQQPDPVAQCRDELLTKGYPGGVVSMAMTWAQNSAEGMATYLTKDEKRFEELSQQFLETYLAEAEKYIIGLVGPLNSKER